MAPLVIDPKVMAIVPLVLREIRSCCILIDEEVSKSQKERRAERVTPEIQGLVTSIRSWAINYRNFLEGTSLGNMFEVYINTKDLRTLRNGLSTLDKNIKREFGLS